MRMSSAARLVPAVLFGLLIQAVAVSTAAVAAVPASSAAALPPAESDGTTALHWAVHNNDKPLVERLLKAGADVNARNDYGATPLAEAAVLADPVLLERLLKAGRRS